MNRVTLPSYPKVFALGERHTQNIFSGPVEVTEKIDGSQFAFGKINGELWFRSKGAEIFRGCTDKLFAPAVDYVCSIEDRVLPNIIFYGETLCKPKHNVLTYSRTPLNHIALFAAMYEDGKMLPPALLEEFAWIMGVDRVPAIFSNEVFGADIGDVLKAAMECSSYLGGCKIEGVVIKNYGLELELFGHVYPFVQAKYVSEKFKEVHRDGWKKENTSRGRWDVAKQGYRTEARWQKAIQHLREAGLLTQSPRDIGPLLSEIKRDIAEEEKENIKELLWSEFGGDVMRAATAGFPEFYKELLVREMTNGAA